MRMCPEAQDVAAVAESGSAHEHVSRQRSRGLWGEMEHEGPDMPQQWDTARRRTSVPPPSAHPSLPIELPASPVSFRVSHGHLHPHGC